MIIALTTAFAQVPTVMMYQVQIKHGKAAAQDVSIEMQLRTSQNGNAVWSQIFDLKDVKNGSVQNLGLDFGSKVDLGAGEFWLATIVDGEEKGCAKLTSVPYAMVAKKIEDVLTSEELIGTWYQSRTMDGYIREDIFTFNGDGTFTFYYGDYDETITGSGIWKLNGAGNLYVKGTLSKNSYGYDYEENVVTTYLDRTTGTLTIGAGDSYFFNDVCNLTKGENGSGNDNSINNGEVRKEFIGKWIGTITNDGESGPATLLCNTDGTYQFSVEGAISFSGRWSANESKLYLTGFVEKYCYYTISENDLLTLNGTGWTGSFTKSATR